MYHSPSKRKQLIARIITYTLMSLSVVVIAIFLVAIILGYRFDSKQGRIEQSALVQYDSTPGGALVTVDGAKLGARTATKSTVLPGTHTFVMQRDQYETWQKTLPVQAGTLLSLTYTRLVPTSRPVQAVKTMSVLSNISFSPAGRYGLAHAELASPEFTLFDLRDDNSIKQTVLTLPATSYSEATTEGVKHEFMTVEWDTGGRYVLLKHTYNTSTEWLVLDTTDAAATVNVTTAFNIDFADPHFSGTSGNVLFVLSNGDIRKIDVQAGTISRPLASHVEHYSLYSTGTLTYVTTYDPLSKDRLVGFIRDGDKAPYILRTTTSDPTIPVYVATSQYYNQDYVAISEGKVVDVLYGSYPSSPDDVSSLKPFASYTLGDAPEWFTMSFNGRFILSQTGDHFSTYDLELQSLSAPHTIPGEGTPRQLAWLDGYNVWSDRSDNITMSEFDGLNEHAINAVTTGFDATLSQNGRYLYTVNKTKDGFALQRVRMIL